MPMTIRTSKSKPEIKFQMAAVRFPEPEVVLSQPWNEVSHRNVAGK